MPAATPASPNSPGVPGARPGAIGLLPPAEFDLPFQGGRNYLHSTDLFPVLGQLSRGLFSPQAFVESLTIRRSVNHQVRAHFDQQAGAFGTFRVRSGADRVNGWLVETNRPICKRVPYDESGAARTAIAGQGFARFDAPVPGHTAFECLLVLMKIVCAQVGPHHWWFSQIELSSPFCETTGLEFRTCNTVASRFLKGHIKQNALRIGWASGVATPQHPSERASGSNQ